MLPQSKDRESIMPWDTSNGSHDLKIVGISVLYHLTKGIMSKLPLRLHVTSISHFSIVNSIYKIVYSWIMKGLDSNHTPIPKRKSSKTLN